MTRSLIKQLILPLVLLTGLVGAAAAQETGHAMVRAPKPTAELEVPLYKSRILSLTGPVTRISVGNPDIADLLLLRSTELYVLGKDLGTTNVLLWDADDILVATVAVEVTHDLSGLKSKLFELMPNEAIEVRAAQRNIVLSGTVSSPANMTAAVAIARGYIAQVATAKEKEMFEIRGQGGDEERSGQVINLMQVGGAQQVMLEVKVAEISRTEMRKFDMRFNMLNNNGRWSTGAVNGGGTFPDVVFNPDTIINPITGLPQTVPGTGGRRPVFGGDAPWGPAVDEFAPNDLFIEDKGLFASLLTNDFLMNVTLEAAKENGLAKILAEPNLTTLSGQEAKFLSGGEFPIPVPQGDETITIQFKEFGVGVGFLPVVLGDGRINMVLNVSVSELVNANSVAIGTGSGSTFLIPSLSKRSANATVELMDGQTIGIAGLLNENLREVIHKFPGLGNLPILGHLFRSQDFVKGETELVILVTPHLAKPIAPDKVKLPTDGFVEPSDTEFYLLGRMEGAKEPQSTGTTGGGTKADFGHDLD